MMALLRLIGLVLAIGLIFYVLLTVHIRSTKREALEREWDRRHPDRAGPSRERQTFVRRSMLGFGKTLRARLVGLVLVLPVIAVIVIVILVNYN